jgi:hypothetical protein
VNGLTIAAVALVEIAVVGAVAMAFTTLPLWLRYRKLKREHDAKARETLERWQPLDGRKPS